MNKFDRQIADAKESLDLATLIVARLESTGVAKHELPSVRAAANQARQAAQELDVLCGMLEAYTMMMGT